MPTGRHVEPGEHPLDTVGREAVEERCLTAKLDVAFPEMPFFLTMTETADPPATRHLDVSLWFALAGHAGQPLHPGQGDSSRSGGGRWRTCATPASIGSNPPPRFASGLLADLADGRSLAE